MHTSIASIEQQIRLQNETLRSAAESLARLPRNLSLRVSQSAIEPIDLASRPRARRHPMVGYGIRC